MADATVTREDIAAARKLAEYAGFKFAADHLDMAIDAAAEAFAAHRAAERERCAGIAERLADEAVHSDTEAFAFKTIATAIRGSESNV